MKFLKIPIIAFLLQVTVAGNTQPMPKPVQFITLDPGHFHAALVQKTMYPGVSDTVYVYAPKGNDLQLHLNRIEAYNSRSNNATHWKTITYQGPDFLEKMLSQKKGNVVVLSGNNEKKTEYILKSLQQGLNVYADKPMAIDIQGFNQLKEAFEIAAKNNVILYDIMTERFEITSILMREIASVAALFGTLEKGTPNNPAVEKESVHNFFKFVSGKVLTRPDWFFDVQQQGNGIADVMTHLVDLVQWECFANQAINYTKDITVQRANRWTTDISKQQFTTLTGANEFPEFLQPTVHADSVLKVYANGEINYLLKGVHVKTRVIWNYEAPAGSGDSYNARMRGTRADLIIRQGAEQKYKPVLYIQPSKGNTRTESDWKAAFTDIQKKYPGVTLSPSTYGWEVIIPEHYKENHEEHFARVTQNFLQYLQLNRLPFWEVPNMLAKYYTTTKALQLAQNSK